MSMSVTMHPIWQTGLVILVACIAGALALQWLVHATVPQMLRQKHTVLGAAVFSVIGTTYAVLLAFMATTAWEQYSAAQDLSRREANLIGKLDRLSHGIAEPSGAAIRADGRAYLAHIIEAEWPAQVAGRAIAVSDPILAHLSDTVFNIVPRNTVEASVQASLINDLTDAIAIRRDRRLATQGTIPDLVWVVLLSGGALLVSFSFLLAAPTLALHMLMTAALVSSGVLVLLLIVGLSSPFHGAVTIAPTAYIELLYEVETAH